MSTGRVLMFSGGQKVTLLELDGLTIQALSTLVYQRSKQDHLLLRIQVDAEFGCRLIHVLPELPLIFEADEKFEAAQVDERFKVLRDSVSADGLLSFDADGQVLEPFRKVQKQAFRVY